MEKIIAGKLLGRLTNGFERDKGRLIHACIKSDTEHTRSFCGAKPGKRSVGWNFENGSSLFENPYALKDVNCSKCLSKLPSNTIGGAK
jgi:hypothetical protein